jgi:hypothetical protein
MRHLLGKPVLGIFTGCCPRIGDRFAYWVIAMQQQQTAKQVFEVELRQADKTACASLVEAGERLPLSGGVRGIDSA